VVRRKVADMILMVFEDKSSLAKAAATQAATSIRTAIAKQGRARVIAATGASQFEFLEVLTAMPGIDWPNVELFHLDEYIGLPADHPASFCEYLQERLIGKTGMKNVHLLDGRGDSAEVIRGASEAISSAPVDIAFVGVGENGHLAFNDPPADFAVDDPYIIVNLDEACRLQQVREGWFRDLAEVPAQAISMSIQQILKSREIICIAPDARKAKAVLACFEGEISVMAPASVLRGHQGVTVYLDRESAGLLRAGTLAAFGG
jgi:glucosamine-6-phosphate deaminase